MSRLIKKEKEKYDLIRNISKGYGHSSKQSERLTDPKNTFGRLFFEGIKNSDNALDVGCGGGTIMDLVRPHTQVTGIDISDEPVAARPDLDILTMSASEMDFEDDSFDYVYHLDGMEHMPAEIEDAVLGEEFRVANKYVAHEIALVPSRHDKKLISMGMTPLHINLKRSKAWKKLIDNIADTHGFKCTHCSVKRFSWFSLPTRQKIGFFLHARRSFNRFKDYGFNNSLYLIYERSY